jgi:hypothetical protein
VKATQAISDANCVVALGGPDTLASLTAGTQRPGKFDDALGVFSGGSRGTPCSRVDVGEQPLKLGLAGLLSGKVALRADLDIEVKADAAIRADLFRNGAPAGQFVLRSGSSIVAGQGSTTPGSAIFNCGARSDSGPDAGAADNCRWVFDGQFDAVAFTALTGSFSLEGGADDPSLDDSLLFLAETAPTGTVTCPSDASGSLTSQLVAQTGTGFSLTGARGEDAVDPGVCTPIDYTLNFDGDTAAFVKLGGSVPNATFLFHITFNPEPAPAGSDPFAYAPTRFSFDQAPTQLFDLKGCRGTPVLSGGTFVGISDVLTNTSLDLLPTVPGVQYACAFEETAKVVGPGQIQVTQGIYLIGDWVSLR